MSKITVESHLLSRCSTPQMCLVVRFGDGVKAIHPVTSEEEIKQVSDRYLQQHPELAVK